MNNLCEQGRDLHEAWMHQLKFHNPAEFIREAMSQYFHHKATCIVCSSFTTVERNRLYTPSLFEGVKP